MKKKIGIITVCRTNNYGAELQAFALQNKLNELGFDAEIIDYLYYKHIKHKPSKNSKPEVNFSKKTTLTKKLIYRVATPLVEVLLPLFHSPTKRKQQNFKGFHIGKTKFSKQFSSLKDLYAFNHMYDVFITGSDQVWNPATFTSLKPYLLDFAPKGKSRIAYAASFGVSEVSKFYKETYSSLFSNFDAIGVREKQGEILVRKIANVNAKVVLDPTLLLNKEDWGKVTENTKLKIKVPYILIYDLLPSKPLLDLTSKMSKQLE